MKKNFVRKKPVIWKKAGEGQSFFNPLAKKLDRLMLLSRVWDKEAGAMARHWELDAASLADGVVFVRTKSSSATHELTMRSAQLVRALNKYFDRPWIKKIQRV